MLAGLGSGSKRWGWSMMNMGMVCICRCRCRRTRRTWFKVAFAAGVEEKDRVGRSRGSAVFIVFVVVGIADLRARDGHNDLRSGAAILVKFNCPESRSTSSC